MLSRVSRHSDQKNALTRRLALPIVLLFASSFANVGTPTSHSLLTSAVAWSVVWVYSSVRLGRNNQQGSGDGGGGAAAWVVGGLLALARVCEWSVDDGRGVSWANALLPLFVWFIQQTDVCTCYITTPTAASPEKSSHSHAASVAASAASKISLTILTCSALVSVFVAVGSNAMAALRSSYAVLTAFAFLLIGKAYAEASYGRQDGDGGGGGGGAIMYSDPAFFSRANSTQSSSGGSSSAQHSVMAVTKDVALAAALATSAAALTFESFSFGGLHCLGIVGRILGEYWMFWNGMLEVMCVLTMVGVHVVVNGGLVVMVQRQGAVLTSFIPLSAAVLSQLITNFSFARLWLAALCAASTYTFLDEQGLLSGHSGGRMKVRISRIITLAAIVSFAVLTLLYFRQSHDPYRFRPLSPESLQNSTLRTADPPKPLAPLQLNDTRVHPVDQLIRDAEVSWFNTIESQSHTLQAAVTEYKRRYGIHPPPNFDKWYAFAKRKNVQLIDEYDTIYHSLLPFWGLAPSTIRARATEALGYSSTTVPNNMLMGLQIRDGKVKNVDGGQEWMQQAVIGMTEQFLQYLPDMDLAFNTHDEPRVVVPHDDLTRLVHQAKTSALPLALANKSPRNAFSPRPHDLGSGDRLKEYKTSRFNVFAHQPVWLPSRLSCPPSSPARSVDENLASDNLTAYALTDLGFIYNRTAFTDVCNSPSLASSHGFFERPNAFNVVHDLFPVFSQSKMSCFNDILYPSPWYWAKKVDYVESKDMDWKAKINSLFWRGSTTGGFARAGGWRRQHRQQMVMKINALDKARVMVDKNRERDAETGSGESNWTIHPIPRSSYSGNLDVHFSHIGQCDPGDCDAQAEFFGKPLADGVPQQDHWKYRFLLDMDGNAFSGRFYAFLRSKSLVFKMAVFREWHEEWIQPWVHYVPLSLRGEEVLEVVRWFSSEGKGREGAVRVAEEGRGWTRRVLRREDFEVWFFRLLLEYGRLVDDNREQIGYAGP